MTSTASTGASSDARKTKSPAKGDPSFDDVMDNALDASTSEGSDAKKTTTTATEGGKKETSAEDDFSGAILDGKTDPTEGESEAIATPADLLNAVTSQMALAIAAPVTPTATLPPVTTSTVDDSQTSSLSTESAVGEETPTAPVPTVEVPTTNTAVTNATAFAQIASTQTEQVALAGVAAGTVDPSGEEKNTAEKTATGTKIPISNSAPEATTNKNNLSTAGKTKVAAAQVAPDKEDTAARVATENSTLMTANATASTAGTSRAEEQPMQSIQEVWPQTAFRAFAANLETGVSSTTGATGFRSSETVTLTSNDQFAEAVQNAIDSQRELYPRRVEIQMHTPPGATVTLSLTRINGELRAQFDANNAQTLNWLNSEVHDLQNMNFGLTVRWSPPQMAAAVQQQESTGRERQEERRREDGRRRNQPRMDAVTGEASPLKDVLSKRG